MIKPQISPQIQTSDSRIHCDYAQLVRIQAKVARLNLLSTGSFTSTLDGRHFSKLRGRGLNFEELRHYQQGDDIRHMDWKVTQRTGKAHVRAYTQEKDRNVIVGIDQRSSMFFSSQVYMKSVIACEISALIGWAALKQSDRYSAFVLGQFGIHSHKSARTQSSLLGFLKKLATVNQGLNVETNNQNEPCFSALVEKLLLSKPHGASIFIISDWHDVSTRALQQLKSLSQANDVVPIVISDPLEKQLPKALIESSWMIGDGQQQLQLSLERQRDKINQHFNSQAQLRNQQLHRLIAAKRFNLVELDTNGRHLNHFIKGAGK